MPLIPCCTSLHSTLLGGVPLEHCWAGIWGTPALPPPPHVPFPSVRVAGGAMGSPPFPPCCSTTLGLSLLHHSSTLTYFWLLSVCAPMWARNQHWGFTTDLI